MSHHYFPFRTTTFDSSGKNFFFWILKLFYNEIFDKFDWLLHLEISQSLMIIQLLAHYTKSFLKSLINQLWYFKMQYSVKFVKNFIVKRFKNSTHKY